MDGFIIDSNAENAQQCAPMKTSRFLLRGFKRPREVVSEALGKLEQNVLQEVWRRQEASVRDIYLAFDEKIAYTTLMTTLDRLFKKKLLTRRKDGRAFFYLAAVSPHELEQGIREMLLKVSSAMAQTKCSRCLPVSWILSASEIASCLTNSIG